MLFKIVQSGKGVTSQKSGLSGDRQRNPAKE